jgi:hypothetical protein
VPLAQPVQPAAPAPSPAPALPAAPGLASPRAGRKPPRRRNLGRVLSRALLGLFCAGLAVGGFLALRYGLQQPDPLDQKALKNQEQGNFRFTPPGGWRQDLALQRKLRVNLGMTRGDPLACLAVFYRDYKDRSPADAELIDTALKKLRGYFAPFQYRDPFGVPAAARAGELGGQPALVLEFEGAHEGVEASGRVHMMTHRGFAYWFFTWAHPENDREAAVARCDAARQAFGLLGGREGWSGRPRETTPFQGSAWHYRLDYANGLWRKVNGDAKAELTLRGFEPVEDEETGKRTTVEHAGRAAAAQVLVLPAAADLPEANKAALAFLLKQQQEIDEMSRLEPIRDKEGKAVPGRDAKLGELPGHLSELEITRDGEPWRYAVVGVAHGPGGVLVVACECRWERRDFWKQEFRVLLESLRPSARKEG